MTSAQPLNLAGLKVLIVDDDVQAIRILKTLLRGFGLKTPLEARDGAEAFEKLNAEPVDLIVVDFLMKPLDGLDFARLVRTAKDSPNPSVPIIMLTAFSEEQRVREARDAGVNAFLRKPVTAQSLYQRIVCVLRESRPFIRSQTYVGPCRRRHADGGYAGPDRRKTKSGDAPRSAR
jgi:CheY-like chemotaxis protein